MVRACVCRLCRRAVEQRDRGHTAIVTFPGRPVVDRRAAHVESSRQALCIVRVGLANVRLGGSNRGESQHLYAWTWLRSRWSHRPRADSSVGSVGVSMGSGRAGQLRIVVGRACSSGIRSHQAQTWSDLSWNGCRAYFAPCSAVSIQYRLDPTLFVSASDRIGCGGGATLRGYARRGKESPMALDLKPFGIRDRAPNWMGQPLNWGGGGELWRHCAPGAPAISTNFPSPSDLCARHPALFHQSAAGD